MVRVDPDAGSKFLVVGEGAGNLGGHRKIENPKANIPFQAFAEIADRAITQAQAVSFGRADIGGHLFKRAAARLINRRVAAWARRASYPFKLRVVFGALL